MMKRKQEKDAGGLLSVLSVSKPISLELLTLCPRKPMFCFLEKFLGLEPLPQAFLDTQNGQEILA